jgi:hypothetical protein
MKFEAYSIGLVCASICTSLPVDKAVQRMNKENPAGANLKWALSEDKAFRCGLANGCDCPDYPGNKHYLLNC